jgi:hypothetical protein
MKCPLASISVLALVLSLAGSARAVTFSDSLSGGLSPTYWTISQDSPSYTVTTSGGHVTIAQTSPTNADVACHIVLNLANAVGGNIAGDYTEQVTFSNASFGSNLMRDQIGLANLFQDGGVSEDVFDNGGGGAGASGNYHYWDGNSIYATTTTAATGGTLTLSRTGSVITASFNGVPFYTAHDSSPLVYADFRLETQGNPNNDGAQASFTNFSITVPEPTSCCALIAGTSILTLRRRGRRLGQGSRQV